MVRCHIQMVIGPAGTGKSTYCRAMQEHCSASNRTCHIINLDPAADAFGYDCSLDVRELISVEDVMEELEYGPNGGLLYAMEYLCDNIDWLRDELDEFGDGEYVIFDCPGQIELYSHNTSMRRLVDNLKMWGNMVCGVYTIDAMFLAEPTKFIAGALASLSAMVALELPHITLLTKCDLADMDLVDRLLDLGSASLLAAHLGLGFNGSEAAELGRATDVFDIGDDAAEAATATGSEVGLPPGMILPSGPSGPAAGSGPIARAGQRPLGARRGGGTKHAALTHALCALMDDFTMVNFVPLDINDEESLTQVLSFTDTIVQYGEDAEVKEPNEHDPEYEEGNGCNVDQDDTPEIFDHPFVKGPPTD